MCKISNTTKAKLGNAIIYIAEHCAHTSKTKLLKLLYLMEERCALTYQMPFLGLDFEVWQAGPVQKDVYIDISDGASGLLCGYVKVLQSGDAQYIVPEKPFCDDEFSDAEICIMDKVLADFGNYTASQLVNYTHQEGSLWHDIAKREHLLDVFLNKESNNSEFTIDFSAKMSDCEKAIYNERLHNCRNANLMRVSIAA